MKERSEKDAPPSNCLLKSSRGGKETNTHEMRRKVKKKMKILQENANSLNPKFLLRVGGVMAPLCNSHLSRGQWLPEGSSRGPLFLLVGS